MNSLSNVVDMIRAREIAKSIGIPVAVENKRLTFDVAYPLFADGTGEADMEGVCDSVCFYGYKKCLIIPQSGGDGIVHQLCNGCGYLRASHEFTHTFHCSESQGPESEDFDECLECRQESGEAQGKAAGL